MQTINYKIVKRLTGAEVISSKDISIINSIIPHLFDEISSYLFVEQITEENTINLADFDVRGYPKQKA